MYLEVVWFIANFIDCSLSLMTPTTIFLNSKKVFLMFLNSWEKVLIWSDLFPNCNYNCLIFVWNSTLFLTSIPFSFSNNLILFSYYFYLAWSLLILSSTSSYLNDSPASCLFFSFLILMSFVSTLISLSVNATIYYSDAWSMYSLFYLYCLDAYFLNWVCHS